MRKALEYAERRSFMAFDAGMVAAIVCELNRKIIGARVEKVLQPEKDEVVFLLHAGRENLRLVLSSGTNNPRFNITTQVKENPVTAPMFCMLLRKHLTGARVVSIKQLGFERAVEFGFECLDEMGFQTTKYIVTETMGKYSNIILLSNEKKVLNALKLIDLATSSVRQILPGFPYELPPVQKKLSPLDVTYEQFMTAFSENREIAAEKFVMNCFYGVSALVSREIAYASSADFGSLGACDSQLMWKNFSEVFDRVKNGSFEPWIVTSADGKPVEYCFFKPREYTGEYIVRNTGSFGELLDEYFGKRDRAERIKQRTSDIFRILTNAETRLKKKIELQRRDLEACADRDTYRLWADLITANIWQISKGAEEVSLPNYYSDDCSEVVIKLDKRLTPQQNAQRYYKKYSKAKTAEVELTRQIKLAEEELEYIYTVFDSLTRAETESDILEIREELHQFGYASKMKNYQKKKPAPPKLMEFVTSGGYRLVCGKNNHQNDYITTRLASRLDYWFHVKNMPGSHCVMFCGGEEPSERDFTEAATVAAYYSKASEGKNVAVDYTLVKNIRKPGGAKPGFVTYSTNYTAYVDPDEALVMSLKK